MRLDQGQARKARRRRPGDLLDKLTHQPVSFACAAGEEREIGGMTALNESAEDIMSRTVESSFERETDPAEEAEQLRKYQQVSI